MDIERLVLHEDSKTKIMLEGRNVVWLMKPETTGGKYSSACLVEVAPGQRALPAHSHPNGEETIYIIQGEGKVLIGDEMSDIKAGSIMLFPQGVPHMLYCTGDMMLKGICFYAPEPNAIDYAFHEDVDFPEFKSKP